MVTSSAMLLGFNNSPSILVVTAPVAHMGVLCGLRISRQILSWYDHHMKLLCASVLIVSLASLAVAEDQTKAVDLGKIPIKTVTVKVDAGSGLATISSATTR